jgi:hypothetical protein
MKTTNSRRRCTCRCIVWIWPTTKMYCPWLSRISFLRFLLQLMAGLQRNFMGTIDNRRRYSYRRLFRVRTLNLELWLLICYLYAYKPTFVSVLFLYIYFINSTKFYWNHQYQEEKRISSDCLGHTLQHCYMQYLWEIIVSSIYLQILGGIPW